MNKWDDRFMTMAEMVATWSRDPSTKVGAVIVDPARKRVVSMGYNGLPRGVEDDPLLLADRPTRLALTVHAELNSLLHAREPLDGYTIYVSPLHPCSHCAASLIQAGIKRVVYRQPKFAARWEDSFNMASKVLREADVEIQEI